MPKRKITTRVPRYVVSGFPANEKPKPRPIPGDKPMTLAQMNRGEGRGVWDPPDQDRVAELAIGQTARVIWGTTEGGRAVTVKRVS